MVKEMLNTLIMRGGAKVLHYYERLLQVFYSEPYKQRERTEFCFRVL